MTGKDTPSPEIPLSGLARLQGCRAGVATREHNRLNYTLPSAEVRLGEKEILRGITGIDEKNIIMLNQVHGDTIIHVEDYPRRNEPWIADGDAMITALTSVCLVIRTADCVPLFLYDEKRRVLGAVHSGWRGCRMNISGKTAALMKSRFNCDPAAMKACILPSIGPLSYRVNEDVARFFSDDTIRREDGLYVDLWKNVETSLVREGLPAGNITQAGICTLHNPDYFSHRRGDSGRNLNYAFMLP